MGQLFSGPPGTSQGQSQEADRGSFMGRNVARAVGTLAGLVAMAMGIWTCVTISAICIAAGMIMVCFGFLMITLEAPCFCMWFDFIDRLSRFSESRPYWQKAILFFILALIPFCMCVGTSTFLGCGLMAVSAVIYGVLALGKKADRDTMMARAGQSQAADAWDVNLVDNQKNPNVSNP